MNFGLYCSQAPSWLTRKGVLADLQSSSFHCPLEGAGKIPRPLYVPWSTCRDKHWYRKWVNACPPLSKGSLQARRHCHLWGVTVIRSFNYSVLGIYSWRGFWELHCITNISFFKVCAEASELRGLLIRKGSFADSGFLVRVHGRPNHDLCARSCRAPASASARSGFPCCLLWAGSDRPGLGLWTLLNTSRWARTFRWTHGECDLLKKKYSHANFK